MVSGTSFTNEVTIVDIVRHKPAAASGRCPRGPAGILDRDIRYPNYVTSSTKTLRTNPFFFVLLFVYKPFCMSNWALFFIQLAFIHLVFIRLVFLVGYESNLEQIQSTLAQPKTALQAFNTCNIRTTPPSECSYRGPSTVDYPTRAALMQSRYLRTDCSSTNGTG